MNIERPTLRDKLVTNRVVAAGILKGAAWMAGRAPEEPRMASVAKLVVFILIAFGAEPSRATEPAAHARPNPDDPTLAAKFSGHVLGPAGQPLAGARVYVIPLSNGLDRQLIPNDEHTSDHPVRATTGADGRFDFEAPDVTLLDLDGLPTRKFSMVVAMADGHGLDWINVRGRSRSSSIEDPSRSTDLELRLPLDDVPLRGQLFDDSLHPLAGARVVVTQLHIPKNRDLDAFLERGKEREKQNAAGKIEVVPSLGDYFERSLYAIRTLPEVSIEARTDAEGRFTFRGFGRDRIVYLKATAPTAVVTTGSVMTRELPDMPGRGANFSMILEKGRTITGIVRDADTKQPIPGMWVGTGRENFPRDGIHGHKTVTDAAGRFTITGLSTDPHKWGVTAMSPPGMTYTCVGAITTESGDEPLVLECRRGIPFRLTVRNEAGEPIDAEVAFHDVLPNPYSPKAYCFPNHARITQVVRRGPGEYEGFVIPGPGALFIKTPGMPDYYPAQVDPKAFFAPGRTDWAGDDWTGAYRTKAENAYGTTGRVATSMGLINQLDYAAIVLVNPEPDSPPLELAATVRQGITRLVTILDPDGAPLAGVSTQGVTEHPYDHEPPLRAATFPVMRLRPDVYRRISFKVKDRQLAGFLFVRGDSAEPCTVRMQPWAAVTGRLLDADGKPLRARIAMDNLTEEMLADPTIGSRQTVETNHAGEFRIDELVPGLTYAGEIRDFKSHKQIGLAFANLVLKPGETRNLGDIHLKSPLVAAAADLVPTLRVVAQYPAAPRQFPTQRVAP